MSASNAPASNKAVNLINANSAVLCYAETQAEDYTAQLLQREIARRNLACTPAMVEAGEIRYARLARTIEAQAMRKQVASATAARPVVTYCNVRNSVVLCPTGIPQ